jgi:hypothetical protein
MHYIALCTPCIVIMLESHTYTFALDPTEPEPALVEDANPEQDQGKPQCI